MTKIVGVQPTKEILEKLSVGDEYIYVFSHEENIFTRWEVISVHYRDDKQIKIRLKKIWSNHPEEKQDLFWETNYTIKYDYFIGSSEVRIKLNLNKKINPLLKI